MTTSFTTPKPSKIPLLLSQSMSSVTSKNNQHKTLKTLLIQSTDSGNEITIGSSEQLAEVYVSPRITAENVLKNCREKKITISTKYSKPSLIVPLRRDYTAMEKSSSPKHYTNSFYLNEQSSGLGSSIVTMRSSIDEIEEKEIKDNVDKIMSFTRMRHSHKFYRNQMGGFDHDFLKNKNWLYLSARGFCRNCKHIPVFLMDYGKIKKYNVVKKRPCICEKLILSSKQNSSNLSTVKVEEQTNIIQLQSKMKTINQQELLFSVLNEHEIYEYFLLILLPGAFAFFVETFFSIITLL
uniref:Uncharacterized protein n=1 Tax=Parastrongyloides trichosuri TaxID=131310 RepID=A0A0N4ZC41_PARTI